MAATQYDLVVVGTGFASTFFLHEWLRHAPEKAKVLVLERGRRHSHAEQLANPLRANQDAAKSFSNANPEKWWRFTMGFGGSSACWWAVTPRMLPADFELFTRYGVGADWPIGYDTLESYYCDAEDLMGVAGSNEATPFERSRPYPLPAHELGEVDVGLQRAFEGQHYVQPTARASRAIKGKRPGCCASSVCHLCPVDAKFTIANSMGHPYDDPRVALVLGATVEQVDVEGRLARGVVWTQEGRQEEARASFVALGCNALFNPFLLLKSGLDGPAVGRGLFEQASRVGALSFEERRVRLGSTSITGHGYMFYDGPHRKERAGALLEVWSKPLLSVRDRGRWAQEVRVKLIFEELRNQDNRVDIDPADPTKPRITFKARSPYTHAGLDAAEAMMENLGEQVSASSTSIGGIARTESHVMGTAVMGTDPNKSVVDADLLHHEVRNLAVLGASAFPSAAPANPTLTLSALSIRAARRLMGADQ